MRCIKFCLPILGLLLLLVGCDRDQAPKNYSIKFDTQSVSILKGEKVQLNAHVEPADAPCELIWKSEDPTIATVDDKGVVHGISVGNVIVSVQIKGSEAKASCIVSVTSKKDPNVPSLTVTPEHAVVPQGGQLQVVAVMTPQKEGYSIVWDSQHSNIATVDDKGFVTAHAVGETLITARIKDTESTAACLVEVKEATNGKLSVEVLHSLGKGYSLVFSLATDQSDMVMIDNGSGEFKEYAVSKNSDRPTQIDVKVEGNTVRLYGGALTYLSLAGNKGVESVKIAQPASLKYLNLSDNKISQLDIAECRSLETLSVASNLLQGSLSLSFPLLTSLSVAHNRISALHLETPKLEVLAADNLQLTGLSLSQTPRIREVVVHHNRLSATAIKTMVSSLPSRTTEKGRCVILDSSSSLPEENKLDKSTTLKEANSKGWLLYDGKVEIKADPVVADDPKGFVVKDVAYLNWAGANQNTITTWELAQGGVLDAKASDTSDPDYMLLVFTAKAGSDILKRVYTLEEGAFVQVEVFVVPLDRVLVTESGAQLRLNKNFVKSLKDNGYSTPISKGVNTFYTDNDALKSKVLISKEIEKGTTTVKLLYSPKR